MCIIILIMANYTNGKIYKIVNDIDNEIYVGSTIISLSRRKAQHKAKGKKNQNRKLCKNCNSIGWQNVSIVLIERYPCLILKKQKCMMNIAK